MLPKTQLKATIDQICLLIRVLGPNIEEVLSAVVPVERLMNWKALLSHRSNKLVLSFTRLKDLQLLLRNVRGLKIDQNR